MTSEQPESSENTENKLESPSSEPITKKDPKRVEQGKRLAMISKEAKERKLREKIEAEFKPGLEKWIFPAIATVSTFSFFYLWFSRKPDNNNNELRVKHIKIEPPKVEPPKVKPPKFETLG